ncbi:MAG: hypothetical protein MK212_13605 [Saprospiraceae bacterium]|nr:hypothetical protein [Saprospiraceae bacterium]
MRKYIFLSLVLLLGTTLIVNAQQPEIVTFEEATPMKGNAEKFALASFGSTLHYIIAQNSDGALQFFSARTNSNRKTIEWEELAAPEDNPINSKHFELRVFNNNYILFSVLDEQSFRLYMYHTEKKTWKRLSDGKRLMARGKIKNIKTGYDDKAMYLACTQNGKPAVFYFPMSYLEDGFFMLSMEFEKYKDKGYLVNASAGRHGFDIVLRDNAGSLRYFTLKYDDEDDNEFKEHKKGFFKDFYKVLDHNAEHGRLRFCILSSVESQYIIAKYDWVTNKWEKISPVPKNEISMVSPKLLYNPSTQKITLVGSDDSGAIKAITYEDGSWGKSFIVKENTSFALEVSKNLKNDHYILYQDLTDDQKLKLSWFETRD